MPAGILCGLLAGALYNRFHRINLPAYLAFFGGRRFVPILSGVAALVLAAAFGLEWQRIELGMDTLSRAVLAAGPWGLFGYGVLNRILIVTGLHHVINSLAWFVLGNYHGHTGDLNRFFAGDPSAGEFMAGFFPVMMFGLPAACLAMYHTALADRRRAVAGLLISIALTAFLTGVTEPVEFSFMFLAPALYAVHALLTGLAFVIMRALHVRLGFGFSAGLFDYVLNYKFASHPLLLLPVGALYFGLYYGIFRFAIVRFDLKTPGREDIDSTAPAVAAATTAAGPADRARSYIAALGGVGNLESVTACTTRLRLIVRTQETVDLPALKRLGARGVVQPSATALQVVVGPIADQIAGEIREAMASMSKESPAAPAPRAPPSPQPLEAAPPAGSAGAGQGRSARIACRPWRPAERAQHRAGVFAPADRGGEHQCHRQCGDPQARDARRGGRSEGLRARDRGTGRRGGGRVAARAAGVVTGGVATMQPTSAAIPTEASAA